MTAPLRMPMDARPAAEVDDARLEVSVCRTLDEIQQALAVRALVYLGEQACPYEEE